jgi:hypothetical protein
LRSWPENPPDGSGLAAAFKSLPDIPALFYTVALGVRF